MNIMLTSVPTVRIQPPLNQHSSANFVATACRLGLAVTCCLLLVTPIHAHEVRPALLEVVEVKDTEGTEFRTLWKLPRTGNLTLRLSPKFSQACAYTENTLPQTLPSAFSYEGALKCEQGLRGQPVEIEGLSATLTDTLLRVHFADRGRFEALLTASEPRVSIPVNQSIGVPAYFQLGVTHMLFGIDHLLFVLGLVFLIVPSFNARPSDADNRRLEKGVVLRLAATVTSFTLAHSITLALAVLGHAKLPQAPVETVIAMSILLLAYEIARDPERTGFIARKPWQMAFAFGLLHGFGFAGALADIGLPQNQIGFALLLFNLGIEAGQLGVIACVLGLYLFLAKPIEKLPNLARALPIFAMGVVSAYWTLDRLSTL